MAYGNYGKPSKKSHNSKKGGKLHGQTPYRKPNKYDGLEKPK